MYRTARITAWILPFALLLLAGMTGCNQTDSSSPEVASSETSGEGDAHNHSAHDHSGWWCGEHGIPEEECSMCSATAAAEFKEKGDWCEEHNRADSQCFICHPERAEEYADLYRAKYGEDPPPRESEAEETE